MKAVLTENLSKTYGGGNKAVDDVSFSLEQDEVFGFLGPNGAGKTTTIKLLCGMLSPSKGSCAMHRKAEHTYCLTVNNEAEIPAIVKSIVGAGGDIYHVSAEAMSLEEIYFSLIDVNNQKRNWKANEYTTTCYY